MPKPPFFHLHFFFVLLCVSSALKAQTRDIANLTSELTSTAELKRQCDLHNQLADKLYSHDFEKGFIHATKALEVAERINYNHGRAEALTLLGTYYYIKGENAEALKNYYASLEAAAAQSMVDFPVKTFVRLSIFFRQTADFDSSQIYLDKARKLIDPKKSPSLFASILASQGHLDKALAKKTSAIEHFNSALRIRIALNDSSRIADTWRSLGSVYSDISQYDSAEYCFYKAQQIIDRLNNPELVMLLMLSRGETNFSVGDFSKAIDQYNRALSIVKANPYRKHYATLLLRIGELNESEGAFQTAYDFLFAALKEFEKMNARQDMARAYTQIGWCYSYQENYPQAFENAGAALKLAVEIGDSSSIAQNKNLTGYLHYKTKRYKESLADLSEAAVIRERIQHFWGLSFTLYNMANTYAALGDQKKSFELLHRSLAIDEQMGKKAGIVFTSNELGKRYAEADDFKKSAMYLDRAFKLASTVPIAPQLLVNYKNYIELYTRQNNKDKVINYYRLYTDLKDSLSNEANAGRMAKSDALFQLQKKASEIELVNKENEINQERIKAQAAEISFQKKIIIGVTISLITLAGLLTIIFKLFRTNQQAKEILRTQNKAIVEQKEEIQAQSEELTESNHQLNLLNDELEHRVNERTLELHRAYQELETFFYRTSHDFRRPLTTYLGLVEVAKSTVNDSHALDLFGKVKETTVGLDGMLTKLQSISNSELADRVPVNLPTLVVQCLAHYKPQIDAKHITITTDMQVDVIDSNAPLLKAALENLIENAIHFSGPTNPFIRIESSRNGHSVILAVIDNGEGIDQEYQSRIFEMYYRASHKSKGNGLGLYISKRAVSKLGGTIAFRSTRGNGSRFEIRLPLEES